MLNAVDKLNEMIEDVDDRHKEESVRLLVAKYANQLTTDQTFIAERPEFTSSEDSDQGIIAAVPTTRVKHGAKEKPMPKKGAKLATPYTDPDSNVEQRRGGQPKSSQVRKIC